MAKNCGVCAGELSSRLGLECIALEKQRTVRRETVLQRDKHGEPVNELDVSFLHGDDDMVSPHSTACD